MARVYREQVVELLRKTKEPQHGTIEHQAKMTLALAESLEEHATALTTAANASDTYSRRLVWATWALVLATVVLVFVAWHRG